MPSTRSTDASETWRSLLIAFTTIHHQLADEMESDMGLPIELYEVLLMLFQAGEGGLRPSEIADHRRLSRSGATRLVDRLARDGLVERRECNDDGRGSVVVLSAAGRETFAQAGRLHLDGIERLVGARLTRSQCGQLRDLLSQLVPPRDT